MAYTYVPDDLTRQEAAAVNWVLKENRQSILSGVPAGRAIDQTLDEALDIAIKAQASQSPSAPNL
ncbi:hypothetical protein QP414_12605 [Corynebacterium simulans]|uniref:hypothetical protein n=1 Tax=Corynebacterium simulans TaxID=146827 RepID=UPI00078C6BEF|nr:hypothetical protein [Corynebacterium simulans]AMO92461.1 hypothetical protein AWU68_2217 [Corynebacterium simulans]MDK7140123.1 hypothetical protein [Corynebacterium simulans]